MNSIKETYKIDKNNFVGLLERAFVDCIKKYNITKYSNNDSLNIFSRNINIVCLNVLLTLDVAIIVKDEFKPFTWNIWNKGKVFCSVSLNLCSENLFVTTYTKG